LRRIVLASAVLALLCATAVTTHVRPASANEHTAAIRHLGGEIRQLQQATWHWQRVMGVRRTETAGRVLAEMSVGDVEEALRLWLARAAAAHRQAQHPPHLRQWLCIHHYEGSWTDRGGPYYGGLQMNLEFQQSYGGWLYARKGTADHWTPLEQIWTAERALRVRGFWPWPNTARFCGLLP